MLEYIGILYTLKFDGQLVYENWHKFEIDKYGKTIPATIGRDLLVCTQVKEQVELWAANLYALICEIENLYFDIVETTYQDSKRYFDEKEIKHDHILQKVAKDNVYHTHHSMFWLIINSYDLKSEEELRPNINTGDKESLNCVDSFCNNYYKSQIIVKSKKKVAKEYFRVWPYKIVYVGKPEWKNAIIEKINRNCSIPDFYKNILLKEITV